MTNFLYAVVLLITQKPKLHGYGQEGHTLSLRLPPTSNSFAIRQSQEKLGRIVWSG